MEGVFLISVKRRRAGVFLNIQKLGAQPSQKVLLLLLTDVGYKNVVGEKVPIFHPTAHKTGFWGHLQKKVKHCVLKKLL